MQWTHVILGFNKRCNPWVEDPWPPHYMDFGHFVSGSHYYLITALGSCVKQWTGRFLGIITRTCPSVPKSNRLHVDILRFSFLKSGYIDSSKMAGNFPAALNINRSFDSSATNRRFSLIIGVKKWPLRVTLHLPPYVASVVLIRGHFLNPGLCQV